MAQQNQSKAPTPSQMAKQAIKLAKDKELLFIEDVAAYMGISKTTLYKYLPVGMNDMNALKAILTANQVNMKVYLRRKWLTDGNATTQIALYKLLASPEEFTRLASQRIEVQADASPAGISDDSKIKTSELPEYIRAALMEATILTGDTLTVDYSLLSDEVLRELIEISKGHSR